MCCELSAVSGVKPDENIPGANTYSSGGASIARQYVPGASTGATQYTECLGLSVCAQPFSPVLYRARGANPPALLTPHICTVLFLSGRVGCWLVEVRGGQPMLLFELDLMRV